MFSSTLGQVALGYAPIIDRHRAVSATRLKVMPLTWNASIDGQTLLTEVEKTWPEQAGGQVLLNVLSESLLRDLLAMELPRNLMLELPGFMGADPAYAEQIQALHAKGNVLMVKGSLQIPVPPQILGCFRYAIIDHLGQDRSTAFSVLDFVLDGVRTSGEVDVAFSSGASAVTGWPLTVLNPAGRAPKVSNNVAVIVDLMQRLDKGEQIESLERTLYRDPGLAYKLIRYMNSAAFSLAFEINSFRHAIMMLGYQNLKRWLALLLASAHDDKRLRPTTFASVRRGLMMETLAHASGNSDQADEMFICGVFSLLDSMFGKPLRELFSTILVPEAVFSALVNNDGPFWPYLRLVRSFESNKMDEIQRAADDVLMTIGQVNHVLLKGMSDAGKLAA